MKQGSKKRHTILIVDDNAEVVDVLRLALEHAGFEVAAAGDGRAALKQARTLLPDLILLDLVLPELDGFSVCEALRRERATARTPIILLTGLSSELNRYAGLDSGADDYLPKPVNLEQLLPRIKELLGRAPADSPASGAVQSAPSPNIGS
jgi:two-component system response regulator RpaA